MPIRVAITALILALPSIAGSATLTGNDVMRLCESDQGGCYWYFAGMSDSYRALRARGNTTSTPCISSRVTPVQLRQAFTGYLRERIQSWHFDAGSLALNAFQKAWPCE